METKIVIEGLKQLIRELAQEKYQVERNGMAKAALDFVDIIENQANGVKSSEATAILPLVSHRTWSVDEIVEELKDIDAFDAAKYFFDKYGG